MVAIYDKHTASKCIQEAVDKSATLSGKLTTVFEEELSQMLNKGERTVRGWKTPSNIPSTIDDDVFFALIFHLMRFDGGGMSWLYNLLKSTSVPVFYPITPELLESYLRQVRVKNDPLTDYEIETFLEKFMSASDSEEGLRGAIKGLKSTSLQELVPLEPEHRGYIRGSDEVCVLGLTLYRYIESYVHDLAEAIRNGTRLRVILPQMEPYIVDMISFRSVSGATSHDQRQRIENTIRTLQRIKKRSGTSNVELRLINYVSPYGITIYKLRKKPQESLCQVRLNTFKTETPSAPTILTKATIKDGWFEFFSQQFELMWENSDSFELEGRLI